MFKQTLLIGVFLVFTLALTGNVQGAGGIGYEYLDGGEVIHIWNDVDDYYLNASSGIQITNYYDEYWTHNIFCLGYNSGTWNYYCTDDLPVTLNVYSDNSTYVQVNGTRSLSVAGRTIIFGIDYYIELSDEEMNVSVGVRNNGGGDITNEIGLAWRTDDIKIGNTYEHDVIKINFTEYDLSDTLDITFNNLTSCGYDVVQDDYVCIHESGYYLEDRNPVYPSLNPTNFTRLSWNPNLNYFVQLKSGSQPNAHVTTVLRTTGLNVGQTKQTTFQWKDPLYEENATTGEGWYNIWTEFNKTSTGGTDVNTDQLYYESTNVNSAGGNHLKTKEGGETQSGAFIYLSTNGFMEGTYSIRFTGLCQGTDGNNLTISTRISDNSFKNYTVGFSQGADWYCNSTLDYGDGQGEPAFINDSGQLDVLIWSNVTNLAYYSSLAAMNITNYTAGGGGPSPDTTDPYWADPTTNSSGPHTPDPNPYEFNITALDDNSSIDTVLVYHNIGQPWTGIIMSNTTPSTFFTTTSKSVKGNTTYLFKFVINDTAGNSNSTGNYTWLVNPAYAGGNGNMTIHVNGTTQPDDFYYGNWSNVSAWHGITGTTGVVMWREGVVQSTPNQIVLLGVGDWNYTVELHHENWTWATGPLGGSPVHRTLTHTIIGTPTGLDLGISPSDTVVDGTEIIATCSADIGTTTIYAEGVIVSNPYVATLAVGDYNITCISDQVGNYTPLFEEMELTVQPSGYGCTNSTTYAFAKNFTNTPPNLYTIDFSSVVSASLVKPNLADVILDNDSIDVWVNFTDGYYFVINTTNNPNFTVYFGNYYVNNTYEIYNSVNDTNMTGYTQISPYYVISFLDEVTGSPLNPDNATESMTIHCSGGSTTFTIQNSTTNLLLATIEQPTRLVTHVSYSTTEKYRRELFVGGELEYKPFYLVDANDKQVAELLISIDDYTSTYGQGDALALKKWIAGSLSTITESYFDIEAKTVNYLIVGDRYALYIDNGVTEVSIGELLVDT